MIATSFGAGQVAYSILWFFLFFIETWLMISIFIDIFRSHDLKGWAKAAWVILVIIFPIVGILAYLIFRGDKMRAHQVQAVADQEAMFRHPRQRPLADLRPPLRLEHRVNKRPGLDLVPNVKHTGRRRGPDARRLQGKRRKRQHASE